MGYTKLNIHYIFTVPLLKRDVFLLLIPERLQKVSSLGRAFTWEAWLIYQNRVVRHAAS